MLKRLFWPVSYVLVLNKTFGLPNQLTVLRFIIGILFLVVLSSKLFHLALALFLVAMVTDFLDGYLARKKGLISNFGRMADPFADKMIICGGFIILTSFAPSVLEPWMVAVIVVRELVISILRGYAEIRGIPFPSSIWGKFKMAVQSVTLCALLFVAGCWGQYPWAMKGLNELVWFTVILTAFSGLPYLYNAWQTFQGGSRGIGLEKEPYELL